MMDESEMKMERERCFGCEMRLQGESKLVAAALVQVVHVPEQSGAEGPRASNPGALTCSHQYRTLFTHANTMPMTIASSSTATIVWVVSTQAAAQHCCGPVLP